jgi:two-component system cell cycle sensor histidine kinase/response regulator CckA
MKKAMKMFKYFAEVIEFLREITRVYFSAMDCLRAIKGLSKILQRLLGENIKIKIHPFTSKLIIKGDYGSIEQVIMNLSINARDAMPDGGTLEIRINSKYIEKNYNLNYPEGQYAVIDVIDTGTGISPEVLPHIFKPLFTTKEVGKGTGLWIVLLPGDSQQQQ